MVSVAGVCSITFLVALPFIFVPAIFMLGMASDSGPEGAIYLSFIYIGIYIVYILAAAFLVGLKEKFLDGSLRRKYRRLSRLQKIAVWVLIAVLPFFSDIFKVLLGILLFAFLVYIMRDWNFYIVLFIAMISPVLLILLFLIMLYGAMATDSASLLL